MSRNRKNSPINVIRKTLYKQVREKREVFAGDLRGVRELARICFLFAFFVLAELWSIGVVGGVCMELPRAKTVPVGGRTGGLEQAPLRRG